MQSKAATVEQYLKELPADRRAAISAVRDVIRKNIDPLCQETMSYGMIGYVIPHSVYPPGYHCDPKLPLPFAGLASQKNHMAVYLMSVYCGCDGNDPTEHVKWFQTAWTKTGKKLDMGKSCIRFTKLENLAIDVIGEAIRRVSVKGYIESYEKLLASPRGKPAKAKPAKKSKAKSKPAAKKKAASKKKK